MARSGVELLDDIEEVLVAGRTPPRARRSRHPAAGSERFAGRFGGVDDRDTLHGHHRGSSCVAGRIAGGPCGPGSVVPTPARHGARRQLPGPSGVLVGRTTTGARQRRAGGPGSTGCSTGLPCATWRVGAAGSCVTEPPVGKT